MSIMSYNGGCVLAMKGKDCVAIAADRRFGVQGLPGLATDIKTVHQRLRFRTNMYELRENRPIEPKTLNNLISSFLYEKRFGPYFIEPIIAGIGKSGEPYISGMDLLGSWSEPEDFLVGGTCDEQLYGMCETLWEPNLSPDELFEVAAQALINSCDRDAISGWGANVIIIEKNMVTIRDVKMRMD